MPVTRAAAAHNTPLDVVDTHPKPVLKQQWKTVRVKAKKTAVLPTGSGDAAAASAPLSPDSNDSTCAVHPQNLAPPPSHLPRKVSTTYSAHISNPSDVNHPVPQLLGRGESDPNLDPNAAFISTRVRWGRDDCGAPQTPVPESPLNMDMSPSHMVACSPPWMEDVQNNNNESQRSETPLYFPSSPPTTIMRPHDQPLHLRPTPVNPLLQPTPANTPPNCDSAPPLGLIIPRGEGMMTRCVCRKFALEDLRL